MLVPLRNGHFFWNMITVDKLEYHLGDRTLFNKISFQINESDRIGLVGKNGAGKSTLLKIIMGEIQEYAGAVHFPQNFKISYLAQTIVVDDNNTVFEEVQKAFDEKKKVDDRIADLTHQIETRTDYESDEYMNLCMELSDLNESLGFIMDDNPEAEMERVLLGLGFNRTDFDRKLAEFSGGWKMRAELAKLLLSNPDLILLDEPTNHLDIVAVQWLEKYLLQKQFPLVLISHDKAFLDNLTNRTIEINAGNIFDYKFHYSKYLIEREQDLEKQLATKANQEKEKERMEKLIAKFRAKANKAAFAQSLIRKLEGMEDIEIDHFDDTQLNVRFQKPSHSGKIVVHGEHFTKAYGDVSIFNEASIEIIKGQKIGLLGKNGIGKSTLIRLICGEHIDGGELSLGHQVKVGYFDQLSAEKLDGNATVFETMEDGCPDSMYTKIRGLLGAFMFSGEDVDKKVKVLSGGEKTRLALCRLMLEPYNFLILDEPTNHLDIASKEVLRQALLDYEGTLLLVSHDRAFMRDMFSDILVIEDGKIKSFIGGLDEFLEKHSAESVRMFESSGNDPKKPEAPKVEKEVKKQGGITKEEKQRLQKIKKLEGQIAELQKQKLELEHEFAELTGAEDNYADKMASYAKFKEELEGLEMEWLELSD